MKIAAIAEDVALLSGYDPHYLPPDATGDKSGLLRRVRMELEDCAREAILMTPPEQLSGWKPLSGKELQSLPDGEYLLPLPPDFLLLHSLRMSDWERDSREILPSSHWLASLQHTEITAVRGGPDHPFIFRGVTPTGDAALRIFRSAPGSTLAEGWYMPAPVIDPTGDIQIPSSAYVRTVRMIAERLKSE
ncbi:MAG: hypothetical protein K2J82_07920 [Muribaculaceae bacterium]|nr:hypothetical protein [Muribaculaceae bacterium]MDE6754523.1 hypothetical protein [Muribaculaceae bacterium]